MEDINTTPTPGHSDEIACYMPWGWKPIAVLSWIISAIIPTLILFIYFTAILSMLISMDERFPREGTAIGVTGYATTLSTAVLLTLAASLAVWRFNDYGLVVFVLFVAVIQAGYRLFAGRYLPMVSYSGDRDCLSVFLTLPSKRPPYGRTITWEECITRS